MATETPFKKKIIIFFIFNLSVKILKIQER